MAKGCSNLTACGFFRVFIPCPFLPFLYLFQTFTSFSHFSRILSTYSSNQNNNNASQSCDVLRYSRNTSNTCLMVATPTNRAFCRLLLRRAFRPLWAQANGQASIKGLPRTRKSSFQDTDKKNDIPTGATFTRQTDHVRDGDL